ncbi:unnamed protein product, partial [Brassica oleracea]
EIFSLRFFKLRLHSFSPPSKDNSSWTPFISRKKNKSTNFSGFVLLLKGTKESTISSSSTYFWKTLVAAWKRVCSITQIFGQYNGE